MTLTNNANLPDALYRAVKNDSYDPGDGDYTATSLLKPAQMAQLQRQFGNEITEDASDRIWSLLGQATHTVLERAGGSEVKEVRLYADVNGKRISAQIDNLCLEKGELVDYKITTGWSFKTNQPPKPEFSQQMNIQAYILRANGYTVNSLYIVGILRDWSKPEARRNPDYPQSQVIKQSIPMWDDEQTLAFINMRIASHEAAKRGDAVACDSSEMWEKPGQWAIMRKGQKRAVKLHLTEQSAKAHIDELADTAYFITYRPGERTRCTSYCGPAKFCKQYQQYLKGESDENAAATNNE